MSADYIASDSALSSLCQTLSNENAIALDTEFIRERTYYSELALIQVAWPDGIALIDPLSIEDFSPFVELLSNKGVLKVLHSADQDLDVFYHTLGVLPVPLFDTQMAAGLLGEGDQLSYAALVAAHTGVVLEKGETRSKWLQRPLTASQLHYAQLDVTYLLAMHDDLQQKLEGTDKAVWNQALCKELSAKTREDAIVGNAWKRLKGAARLNINNQHAAKRLAVWRESEAIRRNLPREWVLSKQDILEIVRVMPQSTADLSGIQGIADKLVQRYGKQILDVVHETSAAQDDVVWQDVSQMTASQKALLKQLSSKLKTTATQLNMSQSLLANRSALEALVRGDNGIALLTTWRASVLGDELLALVVAAAE